MPAAGQSLDLNSILGAVLPFVIIIAVFWFLFWRPQANEQKKRKQMLAAIKKGDNIITVGGIHGQVVVAKSDTLIVKIADKVEVEIERSGVGSVVD